MSDELPTGWKTVRLQDIATWGSGGTPPRKNPRFYGGDIPWIKTGELGDGLILDTEEKITAEGLKNSSAKVFPKGSVAIAMYGATIGKVSILGIDAATNQACAVGIPDLRLTTPQFIFQYLRSQKDSFIAAGKGGAQPNLSQGVIKEWPFPLAPLPEQKRIADKLDALLGRVDACRARLDRVPTLLKRFRQSVLAAATSGELTEKWREENPHDNAEEPLLITVLKHREIAWKKSGKKGACPEAPKSANSVLRDLPIGWSWIPLGVIGVNPLDTVQTGPFGAQLHKEEFVSTGVPVVAVGNLTGMGFTKKGIYFISKGKASDLSRYDVQAGDVLFARSGATLGKVCVAPPDAKDWRMTGHILRARLNRAYLLPEFCVFALRGDPAVTLQVFGGVQGSTRPGYNTTLLESIQLPVPPLPEQREIVRRVEDLFAIADRIEARLATAQKTVERLTPATLAKAFRGELVPQDPNDEPASALLERLRQNFTTEPKKPARGRRANIA